MTDGAQAFYAALDALRAGGRFPEALEAARCAVRPGGVCDWLEAPAARYWATEAFINHTRETMANAGAERVAKGGMRADELMSRINDVLDRQDAGEIAAE